MQQKRNICNFRKYRPISFISAIQFTKLKAMKELLSFVTIETESDVIMAAESFSYIIHFYFEMNIFETPSGIAMIFGVIV